MKPILFFGKAIRHLPDHEMGIYQKGLMNVEVGYFDAALDNFATVLELNPSNIDAMINMALVFGRKGNLEKAEKLITKAYEKDPKKKDGFARLGWTKVQKKDWIGAFEIMNKDWEAKRLSAEWQVNFAQIMGRNGEFVGAAKIIDQAYVINTNLKDGYARLGWIVSERKDWFGALELMNQDLKVNRITPGWKVNLAQIYGRCNIWDLANKLIESAYSENSNLKDGFARLARVRAECNDWINAHKLITTEYKRGRLSNRWKSYMAMIQVVMGDEIGAIATIDEWYANDKNAVDGYAKIGWSYYLLTGKKEKLIEYLNKDKELKKSSTSGQKIIAWALSFSGELALSIKITDLLYSKNNSIKDVFAVMGWLLIEKGEYEKGISLMEKDYRLNRLSYSWKINYAYQLAMFGKYGKAQILYNKITESEPNREQFCIGFHLKPLKILKLENFKKIISSKNHCLR
jgi:tetratricopeptide (TPR) repeat protein